MNVITIGEDVEQISEIDLRTNVIMCALEVDYKFVQVEDKHLYLLNKSDIMLQTQKMIGNTIHIIEYTPNIKWCVPKGVNIWVQEPRKLRSIFQNVYINYIQLDTEPEEVDLINLSFTIYVDKERCKGMTKISCGDKLLEIDLDYSSFVEEGPVENIYVVKNNYMFQEFKTHFDR